MELLCIYSDESGKEYREIVSTADALGIIRNGERNAITAKLYSTDGKLKGERNTGTDETLPEVYRHWWHDDDLNQIELIPD